MEQRNNLVLQGTETFSRGQLDNLALENGALVLDSVAGRSLLYGSYTTPEVSTVAFDAVMKKLDAKLFTPKQKA